MHAAICLDVHEGVFTNGSFLTERAQGGVVLVQPVLNLGSWY